MTFAFKQEIATTLAGPIGYVPILMTLLVLIHHEMVYAMRTDERRPVVEIRAARVIRSLLTVTAFGVLTLRLITLAS